MKHSSKTFSLVADIGGTNTRVALAQGSKVIVRSIRRYSNADFPGLETVLRRYITDEDGVNLMSACIAVAGPVRDGQATMTNLDWTIDNSTLARATNTVNVAILNDLQAQGHSLGQITSSSVRNVLIGNAIEPSAVKLVIGVGTGFNAAPVIDTQDGRLVMPSECGHANLPIRNDVELRLCEYVSNAHGFPAIEDVLSGRGLERIYTFLGMEANDPREASAQDIMLACRDGTDPRTREAAIVFTHLLGTVVGNLSLIHLPFGGVFLVGGVARAFAPFLDDFGFGTAFRDKGRFAGFMNNFSVSVIEDDYAALTGSAVFLATLFKDLHRDC